MKNPTRLFDFPRYQLANNPQDVMMTMPNYGNRVTYSTAQFVEEMDAVSRGLATRTLLDTLSWDSITPLGRPVVPDV